MAGKAAKVDLSNGLDDAYFLVTGTAAFRNDGATSLLALCHLREDTDAGTRTFGHTGATVPAASAVDPGMASVAMAGWTIVPSGSVSTVTVECNQPIAAATAMGARVGVVIQQ